MSFDLNQKITFLNDLVDGTLSIVHYTQWDLSSYGDGSMFYPGSSVGCVRAKKLDECVDKAFKLVWRGDDE